MLRALLVPVSLFMLAAPAAAQAQHPQPPAAADASLPKPPGQKQRSPMLGSPEEEIISRAEIRHAEESYKEMVERADEAEALGAQIRSSFEKMQSLSREDLKKLERMEKLARKIRGGAGGSDSEEGLKDPPSKLESAVSRLAELSGVLKRSVQKTSRLVISAAVIESSNEMIELIRHIRQIAR
ncbi:MAG TPA: hypothetical protein VD968_12370 [Pyrinomonadaceae bacterium]|nr:hypothetical protein [Pyrinomonadaceae bacterium]